MTVRDPSSLRETPSQTAGPYVHIGCMPGFAGLSGRGADPGARMRTGPVRGEEITVRGIVRDGAGAPLRDAMVEIWQADAAGLFAARSETRGAADPHFTGWGRAAADARTGEFAFETVKPGSVPWPDGRPQAPHVTVWIVARGINIGLHTRLYFDDEEAANAADPLLTAIDPPGRAATLLARRTGPGRYRFDIHLQGPEETVFLDM